MRIKSPLHQVSTPRRRFVQGVIAGGVLAAFPSVLHAASSLIAGTSTGTAPELSGEVIDMEDKAPTANMVCHLIENFEQIKKA